MAENGFHSMAISADNSVSKDTALLKNSGTTSEIRAEADCLQEFIADCGGPVPYHLAITNGETREVEIVPLDRAALLVGRAKNCDIVLSHGDVSYRHAYLQLLGGRLLCVDMDSRSGIRWKEERRRSGWIVAGQAVYIGPHEVRLVKRGGAANADAEDADRVSVAEALQTADAVFPRASLELLSRNSRSRTGRMLVLKPGVTLIGRSRLAQIRLKHESVSHVHCSLVLTQSGLWIVDLLGRGGTLVNDRNVEFCRLQKQDRVQVGEFHMLVDHSVMQPLAPGVREKLRRKSREQQSDCSTVILGNGTAISAQYADSKESNGSKPHALIDSSPGFALESPADSQAGDERWEQIIDALRAGGFGD